MKSILSEVVKNEECNWLDVVSTFLWWCWLKFLSPCFEWAGIILGILLWVVCCSIIAAVVTACVALVVVLTSPVWVPFRLWKAPEKVAKLFLNTQWAKWDDPADAPFAIVEDVWKTGVRVMNIVWRPIYSLLPMSKRQWFIKEDNKKLKDYEPATQLAYYDEQVVADKVPTLKAMSEKSMRLVWNRGALVDRANILNSWKLVLEKYQLLFENEDKRMFNLLKVYCANENNSVDGELQRYFVKQLAGERADRAYEVLKVCVEVKSRPETVINDTEKRKTPILEVKTLTDLITMLDGEHGEQAYDILTSYWQRYTLPSEVVEVLIMAATESVVDDGKHRAYKLLKKVASRNGLTTELAELFFSRCDSAENDEMTEVISERIDCNLIDSECVSADDKEQLKKLTDYFTIRKEVSVEGQKLLCEWQYKLYRKTGHKLADEAISHLLVKRLKENDKSFFLQVLDEAWEKLSDADATLMALMPWKRDILIERLAKDERKKAIGTV